MRTKITTTFTWRTKPTTTLNRPRDCITTPFSFDSTQFTFDSTAWTWDKTITTKEWCVETSFSRPRYSRYLQDLDRDLVFDLSWSQVLWISWNKINKIDTNWL